MREGERLTNATCREISRREMQVEEQKHTVHGREANRNPDGTRVSLDNTFERFSLVVIPTDLLAIHRTRCKHYSVAKNLWVINSEPSAIFALGRSRNLSQETLKSRTSPEAFLLRIELLASSAVIASATTLDSKPRPRNWVDQRQARDPRGRYSSPSIRRYLLS